MEFKRFRSGSTISMVDESNMKEGVLTSAHSQIEEVGNQRDPLLISHVLEQMFRNCSTEELTNLRLVCKIWNVISTRILRKKSDPICFTDDSYDSTKMLKVVNVFKESVNPPHVNFEIASNFFTLDNENLITRFFQVCGPFIEILTICTDRTRESKFKFAEVVLRNFDLPRLKALIFEDHTPQDVLTHHNHDFSTFFKALLSSASNLERLHLSFPKRFCDPEGEEIVPQITQLTEGLFRSRSSQQLKHLEISAKITDSQMICLSRSELQLSTLHFRVRNASLHDTSFKALLVSQSSTLEELKLTEEHLGSDFLVKFPKMKRLKRIMMVSICEFEKSIVTFAPFGYQEHLPSIETLILWNCFGKEARWAPFFLAKSPSLTLTRLELPAQFRNSTLAMNISVMFPVLKKLKIGFSLRPENWVVMKTIFETLNSLEELDIRTDMDNQNENIDHVLTGLPQDVCRRIQDERSFLDPSSLDGVKRMPSLVNLKNLRRLEIILDNNRAPYITEVSGYLAFMQMPKLRVLRFTRYGMSKECSDILSSKFRVELIPPHAMNIFEIEYLNMDFD